jgi:hypothetical protein
MTATTKIGPSLQEALKASPPAERDAAAVQLAIRYAELIDQAAGKLEEAGTLAELGPKLLACLNALGMTVAGRGVKIGQPNAPAGVTKLDELRGRSIRLRAVDPG